MGICGSGLRAAAELLADSGCRVSGSDASPTSHAVAALAAVGVKVQTGHAAAHVPDDCELLIYSAAVPPDNPERQAVAARNIRQVSYPQFLGELTRRRN
ncbi:MAG: hypothetical protein KDA75_22855, partial [Planctomycetaceae bacterium]|nr:hypothetical protein [Planctomycetaceae bacterium]